MYPMFKEMKMASNSNIRPMPDFSGKHDTPESQEQKRQELVDTLRAVPYLPSFRYKKDIENSSPFFPTLEQIPGKNVDGALSDAAAREVADIVLDHKKEAPFIQEGDIEPTIKEVWLNTETPQRTEKIREVVAFVRDGGTTTEKQRRVDVIEKIIAQTIASQKKSLSFPLLAMLSEIRQQGNSTFISQEISDTLEEQKLAIPLETEDKIEALARVNNPESNLLTHKIIDFFEASVVTRQNVMDEAVDEYGNAYFGFSQQILDIAEGADPLCENYLVQRHFENIEDMASYDRNDKEGAISGIAGGLSDETVYAYQHLKDSYDLRLKYGIHEGYLMAQLVLPIAPGYLGKYNAGRLEEVFDISHATEKANTDERKFIAQNNPVDDYIYDILNKPIELSGRQKDPSNKLQRLDEVWSFKKSYAMREENSFST
jgi:hypothetical protein